VGAPEARQSGTGETPVVRANSMGGTSTLSLAPGQNSLAESLGPWRKDAVAQRLRSIGFRQRLFNLLALLLVALCAFLCYLCSEMLLDRRWEFTVFTREMLLSAFLCACGSVATVLAARMLLLHSNLLFHARAAERAMGLRDEVILTYVSLRRARVVSATEAQAAALLREQALQRLSFLETDQVVDTRPLLRALWGLGAGLVVLFGLSLAWDGTFMDSFYRCLLPARGIAPPRLARIVNVSPGSGVAVSGEPVKFSAEVRAARLPTEARLVYRVQDESSETEERLLQTAPLPPTPSRAGEGAGGGPALHGSGASGLYAKELPGFLRPVAYWVRCGDAQAGPFQLDIVERPLVTAVSVRVLPPVYAPFAPVREVAGGNVQAITGSRLEISASVTRLPRPPRLVGDTESAWLQAGTVRLPMALNDKTLTATVTLQRDFDYRIGYVDANGLSSRESIQYQVKALPDQAPAAFLRREDGAAETPAGARGTVMLRGEATDDLGVGRLTLLCGAVGALRRHSLDCSPALPAPSLSRTVALDLRPLELKEGDTLECVLVAEDVKKPAGQRAESAPLRIPIVRGGEEQESLEIGRKREPAEEKAAAQSSNEPPSPGKEPAPGTVEKLNEQADGLLREMARLAEQGHDEQTKREIAQLATEQEQVADKVVGLIEKEQQEAGKNAADQAAGKQSGKEPAETRPDSAKNTGANGEPRENQGKDSAGKDSPGKEATGKGPAGKDAAGKEKAAGADQAAEREHGTGREAGQAPKGDNGGAEGRNAQDAAGKGNGGQGQNGKGNGQEPGPQQPGDGPGAPGAGNGPQNNSGASKSSGTGAQSPAASEARAARKELAAALEKLRAGEDEEETLHQAKAALDHLFRAGRAFSAKDLQKLAEQNKDATVEPGKRIVTDTSGQPPGPAGRSRAELASGKGASNVVRNVPGELKEEALGQPTEKGQVRIAPEYRKALEDYYKAIAR